jgi:hypothetical protein
MIIGGLASSVLGEPRTTADVDMLLFTKPETFPGFLNQAKQCGFKFDKNTVLKTAKEKLCFQMKYGTVTVDCLLAETLFEHEALFRKIKIKIGNFNVFFPSPEDFILMKLLVGRDKDILDIKNVILRHKNKLDHTYLITWAEKLQQISKTIPLISKLNELLK